jgi:signal transduction histidine kinase
LNSRPAGTAGSKPLFVLERASVGAENYHGDVKLIQSRRLVAACSLMFVGTLPVTASSEELPAGESLPVVTNVMQFNQLASRAQPSACSLHLEGWVRWTVPDNRLIVFEDESGAAIVEADPFSQALRPGQRVELDGECSESGNGGSLRIGRRLLVDNDGIHGTAGKSEAIFLNAGQQPICVSWFVTTNLPSLEVDFAGTNLLRQKIPDASLFHATIDPASGTVTWLPGVDYEVYEGQWPQLPDFQQLKPVKRGVANNFDLKVKTSSKNVGIRFTGYIEVPRDGSYTFSTISSDGSQLFIGLPRLRVVGAAPLPAPRQIRLGQTLAHNKDESPWAVVEGVVTFISRKESRGSKLELSSGTGRMRVEIDDRSAGLPELLLNSRVRLTGICRNAYTLDGLMTPGTLWVPGLEQVEILEASPKLWSDQAIVAIRDLMITNSDADLPMVHISARVQSVETNQSAVIEDETGKIVFQLNQRLPKLGDRVEVLAKCGLAGTNMVLSWGIIRQLEDTNREAGQLPVLTTADQIMQLKHEEAAHAYPVRIRGVIIWSGETACLIQDATSGVYVDLHQIATNDFRPPRVGEYWEIEGATEGRFSPVILAGQTIRLGIGTLPEPLHPTMDQLLNGALDEHYVEIQGIVTAVEKNRLTMLTHGGMIQVYLVPPLWDGEPSVLAPDGNLQEDWSEAHMQALKSFQDALIRVRGCLSPVKDVTRLSFKVGEIQIRAASIDVDRAAPVDPFDFPAKHVAELAMFDPQASVFQQIKVSGQVIYARSGEYYLMDGPKGLRFIPKTTVQLQAGDLVEVAGFPELGSLSPVLREAVVRQVGKSPLPHARQLMEDILLNKQHDSTLVELQAQLVSFSMDQKAIVLGLKTGSHIFSARLDAGLGTVPSLPVGSQLDLIGVYAGQKGDRLVIQNLDSFELLLNSPSDIQVLSRPSWWTLKRLLIVTAILVGMMVLASVWISLLRRQVEQRTVQLRQEISVRERAESLHAVEVERSRIARDLHDDLGSSLTEISMLADAGAGVPPELNKAGNRFRLIAGKARSLVNVLDVIVWLVNPQKDSLPFFVGYLGSYAEEFLSASAIACRLKIPLDVPPLPLSAEARHSLFLAVKEILNNVVRHAHAGEVTMELTVMNGELKIIITDNGCGFDPSTSSKGNGLDNLRERLAKLGGQCHVESRLKAGATISLTFPLSPNSTQTQSATL